MHGRAISVVRHRPALLRLRVFVLGEFHLYLRLDALLLSGRLVHAVFANSLTDHRYEFRSR
jgi:hypothetical protein